ncbi:Hypothetical protein PHPALM_17322 [Phytophthora palmivora]|uniref:Uncharacterized protein n=1 Tax=Phytophthora palmivora TaxID=4796 RepID=A0A2P4XMI0_9STRA|nr:Hypothetical protein PHPALM_17322 [Phytophthora palmivora]
MATNTGLYQFQDQSKTTVTALMTNGNQRSFCFCTSALDILTLTSGMIYLGAKPLMDSMMLPL